MWPLRMGIIKSFQTLSVLSWPLKHPVRNAALRKSHKPVDFFVEPGERIKFKLKLAQIPPRQFYGKHNESFTHTNQLATKKNANIEH